MSSLLPAALGLAFGLRHALEPDHLAAVSTLAAEQRSARACLGVGLWWGLGHAAMVLLFGGALTVSRWQLAPHTAAALEFLVGLVVMGLGVRALLTAVREGSQGNAEMHQHGPVFHSHAATGAHLHLGRRLALATRPLLMGALHGLAGSGALVALVMLELPNVTQRLTYLVLFCLGAVASMGLLTGLLSLPLSRWVAGRRVALGTSGVFSVVIGVWWAAVALK